MAAPGGFQPLPKKAEPRSASPPAPWTRGKNAQIPQFQPFRHCPLLEKTGIFIIIVIKIFGFAVRGGTPRAAEHAWDKRSRCRSPGAASKNSSLERLNLFRGLLGRRGRCPASTAPCSLGRAAARPCPHPPPQKSGCTPGLCPLPVLDFREEQLLLTPVPAGASLPRGGGVTDSAGWGPPATSIPRVGLQGEAPGRGPEEKEINKRGG